MVNLDPRKLLTGTGYKATGNAEPPAELWDEMGSAARTYVDWEVPELSNLYSSIQAYDRMVNNDVSADVSLRAAKVPVQNGYYYIDAADGSDEADMIAQFVTYNLFDGLSIPFLSVLEDVLRMFEYGFSVTEKVWETREWGMEGKNRKQYTMLKKLAPRPSNTLNKFEYNANGGPVAMVQNRLNPSNRRVEQVTIPISKLIVFTMNKKGGSLEGRSVLRPAYKHWFYKDNFYKIDGIQKERHGIGIPDVELPPGWTDAEFQIADNLAKNLRTNEKARVVRPPGFNVSFLKPEGQLVNVLESADHHDLMIMKNVFSQFMNLGLSVGGSRAVSSSQFDMFLKALRYVANLVCENFNYYLIPQLVGYNFETDKFPKMKVRRLGEARDLQMFAAGMANLAKNSLITLDEETEAWIRDEVDMPKLKGSRPPEQSNGNKNGKVIKPTGRLPKAPASQE